MKKNKLILVDIKQETKDTKTLSFEVVGKKIDFKAGQFLNLFFLDDENGHGKPYTISSSPKDELKITVKKIGKFSTKLHTMEIGDSLNYTGPFGFLTLDEIEDKKKNIIFIAGGIGVTPFYSMINDIFNNGKKNDRQVFLFYANQKKASIIFYKKLEEINKKENSFNLYHFLSRDDNFKSKNIKNRRLEIKDIENYTGDFKNNNFFICGSVQFVDDFWKALKKNGVPEDNVFTEAFFAG